MSRVDNEVRITPSVLDRLLDDRPDQSRDAPATRQTSLRLLKDAVRRDLEWLLNARLTSDSVSEELPEVAKSLAAYGLPDLTSTNVHDPDGRDDLRRAIEKAVTVFEPRLEGDEVQRDRVGGGARYLRLRIDARLRVEPTSEPVVLTTMSQSGNGEVPVKGD